MGAVGRKQRKDLERRERRLQIGLKSLNLPLLPHLDKNYYHPQSFFKHIKNPSSSQGLHTEPNLFPGGPHYTLSSLMVVFTIFHPILAHLLVSLLCSLQGDRNDIFPFLSPWFSHRAGHTVNALLN